MMDRYINLKEISTVYNVQGWEPFILFIFSLAEIINLLVALQVSKYASGLTKKQLCVDGSERLRKFSVR